VQLHPAAVSPNKLSICPLLEAEWLIPFTSQIPCSPSSEYYALRPALLHVENYGRLAYVRLSEKELRSPPRFLQTSRGQLQKVLNAPFAFYRYLSKIHLLTLQYSDLESTPLAYGAMEEPDYLALAGMDLENFTEFQESIARLIWEAYDVEWWLIIKERASHRRAHTRWDGFPEVLLDLSDFPVTVQEYRTWSVPQMANPLLKTSTKFGNGKPEIVDLGELYHWPVFGLYPFTPAAI
jgi:hypothetical protein